MDIKRSGYRDKWASMEILGIFALVIVSSVTMSTMILLDDEDPANDGFNLSIDPMTRYVEVNGTALYNISLIADDEFNGTVELTVLDCYDGVISSLDTELIEPGEVAVLSLTPLCQGSFKREIIATSGGSEDKATVFLIADNDVEKDDELFILKARPRFRETDVNGTATYNLSLITSPRFEGTVKLTVLDCYDGVISTLDSEEIGPNETVMLELSPMFGGSFRREIVGESGIFQDLVTVFLEVRDGKKLDPADTDDKMPDSLIPDGDNNGEMTVEDPDDGGVGSDINRQSEGMPDAPDQQVEDEGPDETENDDEVDLPEEEGSFYLLADPVISYTTLNEKVTYTISLIVEDGVNQTVQLRVLDCFDGVLSSLSSTTICTGETVQLELTPMIEGSFRREIIGELDGVAISLVVFLEVNGDESP